MIICPQCNFKYTDDTLVNLLHINDSSIFACPICALEMIRAIHEVPHLMFEEGTASLYLYEIAIKERQNVNLNSKTH